MSADTIGAIIVILLVAYCGGRMWYEFHQRGERLKKEFGLE
jgi:hypothetical protein